MKAFPPSTTSHVCHQLEAENREKVEEEDEGDDEEDREEARVVVRTCFSLRVTKEKAEDEAKDADDADDCPEETRYDDVGEEDGGPVEDGTRNGQQLQDDDGRRDEDHRWMIKMLIRS